MVVRSKTRWLMRLPWFAREGARAWTGSCFDRTALEGKQTARPLLNEENDRDQKYDLAEHGAGDGFQQLVCDPESHGTDQRAPEVADASEDDDHETVDDVALPEIGTDIVDLRQGKPCHSGDTRPEAERERVDAVGLDAH